MRLYDSTYKLKVNDDIGDPRTLNVRFQSVDGRLASLENVNTDWQAAIAQVTTLGLQHINDVLEPAAAALLARVDIGAYFIAHSSTEHSPALGDLIFFVDEADRVTYAPPAYVAIFPSDGSTSPAMFGRVTAFDRPSGQLNVTVDQMAGSGTLSAWVISPTSPTDNAGIASVAAGARDLALSYRADAQTYRDEAQNAASDAVTARDLSTAASADATTYATIAETARDDAVAAVASQNQYWLGGYTSAPVLDNQGNPLVNGAAYVNLTDANLYYRVDGAWTNVVVPVGSEVLSVYGRTGSVVAVAGDYNTGLVSRTAGAGGVGGATSEAAILDLKSQVDTKLASAATTAFTLTLLDDVDAATARGTLGLGSAATHATTDYAAAVHAHDWADITTGKPTTIGGYGITDAYTKAQTDASIAAVVGAAPGTLDTLNELATALGDDPNFAATMTSSLAGKLNASAVSTFALTFLDDTSAAAVRTTIDAAQTAHTHAIADVTGLQGALDGKQPLATVLTSIAGATWAADRFPYFTSATAVAVGTITTAGRALIDDADVTAQRTTLGLRLGVDVQAFDATLLSIAALGTAADRLPYTTAIDTWAETTFTAAGRALVDDADAAAQRTTLGLAIGTNVQAFDATLLSIALLGTAANKIAYTTGVDTWAEATTTSFSRARWARAVASTASSATPTPNADTDEVYELTALAAAATFGAPTGTPVDGQLLRMRLKDNGTARALTWNAIYRAGTDLALPTTTVISKTMYLAFMYNGADVKWDYVAQVGNI